MIRLARFSTRRPFASLAIWLAVAAALAAIGLGVSSSLSPTIVVVPGSETARAEHLAESNFGPSVLVPVMLEGPKAAPSRFTTDAAWLRSEGGAPATAARTK